MEGIIKVKIRTQSNLFIGGTPGPFVIGAVDQCTVKDQDGFPYIPGSSLKGALRNIMREDTGEMVETIRRWYTHYLSQDRQRHLKRIEELVREQEAKGRIESNYEKAIDDVSPQYLFGIIGFNATPKLLFSDLRLCEEMRDKTTCFSIDMKNTINTDSGEPKSIPRTYKAARSGLVFEGDIRLHRMEGLGESAGELVEKYVIDNLLKFNDGIYRLGNSKSRGYGKVEVMIVESGEDGKP